MTNTVISYPIPIYQNVPIDSDFYNPSQFVISSIVLGVTTSVTTTTDLNYSVGQEVRLNIPPSFGCYQLNGKTGFVLTVTSDTVILNIDSSHNVDAYVSSSSATPAQIIAIGDINTGNIGTNGLTNVPTNIPGAFINVSPE
jgi:hypothetical protein